MSHTRTVAEFFAGIGLMRLGLEKAGWRIAFANDIDPKKFAMYCDHFGAESSEFVIGDIHQLNPAQIPAVALATASFPCNDLSLAGGRIGLAGEHSSAFWGFIDILEKLRRERRMPRMVLLENVPGFLTSHDGRDFEDALLALNDLGYAVDAFIVDAARFVPQSRQRLFVAGSVTNQPHALDERHLESEARPLALKSFILMHPDIAWRIRQIPPLPARSGKRLEDIVEDLPPNHAMWWSRERCECMLNQMSERHRAQAEQMIHGARTSYGTVFRRVRNGRSMAELRTDGIAGCLRTPRGGSGRQILFMAGNGRFAVRLLTARECARLMGADEFLVKTPLNQALFGFGDAVCVSVIEWIARNYLNPLWADVFQQDRPAKNPGS